MTPPIAVLAAIGFSVVAGPLLMLAYLVSDQYPKSRASVAGGVLLTAALCALQVYHYLYMTGVLVPLDEVGYRFALFVAPGLFVLFGRTIVLPDVGLSPAWLLVFAPTALPLALPLSVALPLLLLCGAAYALWLSWQAFAIRRQRPQYRFELLFSLFITGSAAVICALGAMLPWSDAAYFYLSYAVCIGVAYALVVLALVAIPGFVADLFEVTRVRYASSTLGNVSIDDRLRALDRLMTEQKRFRDDELNLAVLAEEVQLSAHQLSELINQHRGMSFSQYVRRYRIEEACRKLRDQPEQTVLTIALEVGHCEHRLFGLVT